MNARRSAIRISIALLLAVMSAFSAGATDPLPDSDGDGVPDLRDRCARTPAGMKVDQYGCTHIQLALGGHRMIIATALEAAQLARQSTSAHRELGEPAARMSTALESMEAASLKVQQGLLCDGAGEFSSAVRQFQSAADDVDWMAAEMIPPLLRKTSETRSPEGDADENDAKVAELEISVALSRKAADALSDAAPVVGDPCDAIARPAFEFAGRIVRLDESAGVGWLQDGTIFSLPRHDPESDVYEGGATRGIGSLLDDGTVFADWTITIGDEQYLNPSVLDAIPVPCLRVRVAPYQDFYWNPQPAVTHPLDGYDRDGLVWLEDQMRLGVANVCTGDAPSPQLGFTKRTMKIAIQYKSPKDNQVHSYTVASSLSPGQAPAGFPSWLASLANAQQRKLVYTERKQSCVFVGLNQTSCSSPIVVSTTTKSLGILALGGYCTAQYAADTFTLDDDDTTGFQSTHVTGMQTPFLAQPQIQQKWFEAQGYAVVNGTSSRPNLAVIGQGQPFAIYNDDFQDTFFLTGTTERSGLMWPRVKGVASGQPFWYSCTLPTITRDAVGICNQYAEHAYYRIPFGPGSRQITQGNNGSFTHNGNQAYAFDFAAAANTPIRAARGGVVLSVDEANWMNCYPDGGCKANKLVIQHSDGTYGIYFHMPTAGIDVDVNDVVHRGDVVGSVGNTGYSTGPHLHFHVKAIAGGPTIRHRYELYTANFVYQPCYIPSSGETVISNNV